MASTRRAYAGSAQSTTTSSAIAPSGTTSFTITAYTGWPYGSDPFFVVVEPGTASEEKILVTRTGSTDTTINIASDSERGQDGTSAVAHSSGSIVFPVFTALDADEANELTSSWSTKGDLVSYGSSTFETLGVGSDAEVLIADSGEASGLKWGQVTASGIANSAVTTAKLDNSAVDATKILTETITFSKLNPLFFQAGVYSHSGGYTASVSFVYGMVSTPIVVAMAAGSNSVVRLVSTSASGFTVQLDNTAACSIHFIAIAK